MRRSKGGLWIVGVTCCLREKDEGGVHWLNNATELGPKKKKKSEERRAGCDVGEEAYFWSLRKEDTEVERELEFPADVGFDARAVGAWPQVEVVSSHWFSPCRNTQSI